MHFCQGLPVILVGCKKDLRRDPKTIEELRKTSQRPVTPEEVGFSFCFLVLSWGLSGVLGVYRVWLLRRRLVRATILSVLPSRARVCARCSSMRRGRLCFRGIYFTDTGVRVVLMLLFRDVAAARASPKSRAASCFNSSTPIPIPPTLLLSSFSSVLRLHFLDYVPAMNDTLRPDARSSSLLPRPSSRTFSFFVCAS